MMLQAVFRSLMSKFNSLFDFIRSHRSVLYAQAKKALFLAILWGLVMQLDPFGMKSATDIHSENLFNSLFSSHLYPADKAQKKTTVVIIDKIKGSWPPNYKKQAGWLSEILMRQPKAVFVDFIYGQKHGSAEELKVLTDTLQEHKQKFPDIPIYFPFPLKADKVTCNIDRSLGIKEIFDENSIIPEIRNFTYEPTYVGWSECGNRHPLYLNKDNHYPTPAMTMFKKYCSDNVAEEVCKANIDDALETYSTPMAVVWGSHTSRQNEELFSNFRLPCKSAGFWRQVSQMLVEILKSTPERGLKYDCTFTDTVLISMLNSSSGDSEDPLEYYIKDRYVFIGAAIDLNNDYIINSVNGKIPGVYLLAMAFDNLVNYGPGYFRDLDNAYKTIGAIAALFVVNFFLEVTNLKLQTLENDNATNSHYKYRRLLIVGILMPLSFGLILAIICWEFRIAARDLLGITLIAFFINPVSISEIYEATEGAVKAKVRAWIRSID